MASRNRNLADVRQSDAPYVYERGAKNTRRPVRCCAERHRTLLPGRLTRGSFAERYTVFRLQIIEKPGAATGLSTTGLDPEALPQASSAFCSAASENIPKNVAHIAAYKRIGIWNSAAMHNNAPAPSQFRRADNFPRASVRRLRFENRGSISRLRQPPFQEARTAAPLILNKACRPFSPRQQRKSPALPAGLLSVRA